MSPTLPDSLAPLVRRWQRGWAREGMLVSTPQGRGLYSSLGWRHRATVVVARAPGVR